jgi:hypothetical protein
MQKGAAAKKQERNSTYQVARRPPIVRFSESAARKQAVRHRPISVLSVLARLSVRYGWKAAAIVGVCSMATALVPVTRPRQEHPLPL